MEKKRKINIDLAVFAKSWQLRVEWNDIAIGQVVFDWHSTPIDTLDLVKTFEWFCPSLYLIVMSQIYCVKVVSCQSTCWPLRFTV